MIRRVAMVCPYGLSRPGGVQQQSLGLARALGQKGIEVALFAPDAEALSRNSELGELEVIGLGRSFRVPANGSQVPIAPMPSTISRTIEELRRFRPDVVHVHEPLVPGPSLGAVFAKAPLVATFHRGGAGISAQLAKPLAKLVASRLNAAVAVSELAATTARRYFGGSLGEISVLFNGVDVCRFSPETDREASSDRRDPLQVVFVGRHERRKGLSVLLRAFAGLQHEAHLVVVGEGPETAALKASFGNDERVRFVGRLEDEQLAQVLRSSSILCAPAISGESFGLVLLEAMAAGTAVVASRIAGYEQAAGDAVAYFAPGDEAELRSQLFELLANEEKTRALAAKGRARVAGYSFDALVSAYLPIYERAASTKSGSGSS